MIVGLLRVGVLILNIMNALSGVITIAISVVLGILYTVFYTWYDGNARTNG